MSNVEAASKSVKINYSSRSRASVLDQQVNLIKCFWFPVLGVFLLGSFSELSSAYNEQHNSKNLQKAYNSKFHPYFCWVPILAYTFLRNTELRSSLIGSLTGNFNLKSSSGPGPFNVLPRIMAADKYVLSLLKGNILSTLSLFEHIGKLSLELYLLQCHTLMCANATRILVLIPGAQKSASWTSSGSESIITVIMSQFQFLLYLANCLLTTAFLFKIAEYANDLTETIAKQIDWHMDGRHEVLVKSESASSGISKSKVN